MRTAVYFGVLFLTVAVGGLAAVWWANPEVLEQTEWWAGAATTSDQSGERAPEESAPDESGAPANESGGAAANRAESGPYEPESEYVAEGFDPDKRVVDFSEASAGAESGPSREILTSRDVQRILHKRSDQLIPCYQKVLDERPDAAGEVHFSFAIDSDGEVRMVRITDSELRSPAAEDCLVQKTRDWTFPKTHLGSVTRFQTSMKFRLR